MNVYRVAAEAAPLEPVPSPPRKSWLVTVQWHLLPAFFRCSQCHKWTCPCTSFVSWFWSIAVVGGILYDLIAYFRSV